MVLINVTFQQQFQKIPFKLMVAVRIFFNLPGNKQSPSFASSAALPPHKVERFGAGNVTDAAAWTETTKHQFHLQELNMRNFFSRSSFTGASMWDLIERVLDVLRCSKWAPFGCVEWGQKSAVTPSSSGVISERCVKQKACREQLHLFLFKGSNPVKVKS